MAFADHFSSIAAGYARYRPTYPEALFDWVAEQAPARDLAWDCGTGSGQAAVPLAARFAQVIGTDPSAQQLAQAPAVPNIEWRVAPAEASTLPDGVADTITVAQALHWFDLAQFWAEVARVGRPEGVFVAWSYGKPALFDDELNSALRHFHDHTIGPWWPMERGIATERYGSIAVPFPRIAGPGIAELVEWWSLEHFMGYLRTWSGVRRFMAANGYDPVATFETSIRDRWGLVVRRVSWPFTVIAARLPLR